MKIHLLNLVFSLISCCCLSQNLKKDIVDKYILTGELIGRDTGFIILWIPDTTGIWVKDTARLVNGKFKFEGYLNEPSFAHLIGVPRKNNYADFYVEKGNQHIVLKQNDFYKFEMIGSDTQKDADSLYEKLNSITSDWIKIEKLYTHIKNSSAHLEKSSFNSYYNWVVDTAFRNALPFIDGLIELTKISFIKSHPDSYVSPTELLGIINGLSLNNAFDLFDSLNDSIKNSRAGLLCFEEIQKKREIVVGKKAPEFNSIDSKNKNISLTQFKGKYVLLDFWASWCKPCRITTPILLKYHKTYNNRGLEIIAIADDDRNVNAWKEAINRDKTNHFYHLLNGRETSETTSLIKSNVLTDKYAVSVLPTKYLIDPDGTIIGIYKGSDSEHLLQEKLDEIFKR